MPECGVYIWGECGQVSVGRAVRTSLCPVDSSRAQALGTACMLLARLPSSVLLSVASEEMHGLGTVTVLLS